jgi:hypothetical protein
MGGREGRNKGGGTREKKENKWVKKRVLFN